MRLTREFLIDSFSKYTRSESDRLVGAEFERHLLLPNGHPLPYLGHGGVGWLLQEYAKLHAWEQTVEGPHTIALSKGRARITLEPGAQLELSGSPFSTMQEIEHESLEFDRNVSRLLEVSGATQATLGPEVTDEGLDPTCALHRAYR